MTDNNKHLVRVGHEFAAAMSDDTPIITIAKMVTELASALDVQSARSDALAVENAALKSVIGECQGYFIAGIRNTIRPTNEGYLHMRCDTVADETPATDAWVNEQRAAGVEKFVSDFTEPAVMNDGKFYSEDLIEASKEFAAQLRGSQV